MLVHSRYIKTHEDQLLVRELSAIGLSDDDIAAQLRLRLPRFQKIFKLELKLGAAEGREQALRKLHAMAISGENFQALSLFVKSRCGWRDTGPTPSASPITSRLFVFKPKTGIPGHDRPL